MTATNAEVRKARNMIYSHGLNSNDIPPKLLAITAKKTNTPLRQLLSVIAKIKLRGQGEGEAPLGQALAGDD